MVLLSARTHGFNVEYFRGDFLISTNDIIPALRGLLLSKNVVVLLWYHHMISKGK